jgi:Fe-S-cluster containining protein
MQPWYQAGLAFECTQCGRCCGGSPGVVWVDSREIAIIAQRIGVEPESMWGDYIRRVACSQVSLVEQSNGDCIFLRRNADGSRQCVIYDIRPQQCRTWPFWSQNLRGPNAWNSTTAHCPGVNRGRRYTVEQIEAVRQAPAWYARPESERNEVTRG